MKFHELNFKCYETSGFKIYLYFIAAGAMPLQTHIALPRDIFSANDTLLHVTFTERQSFRDLQSLIQ